MGSISTPAIKLIAYGVFLVIVASTAVALRLMAMHIRKRSLARHDLLCLFALFNLVGYTINFIIGTTSGALGLHQAQVLSKGDGYRKTVTTLKVFWVSEIFWSTAITSIRLAILSLYIEIFRRPRFYIAAISASAVVIAYFIACMLTILLLCRPLDFNWNKTLKNGTCGNSVAVEIFSAAFNMSVDVVVVCLPLPIVWNLQIPLQKKVAISAIFALGFINAGINLARLIQNIMCDREDATYCALGSGMLVMGEMSTGILVACVPTLGPIFYRSTQHSKITPQRSSKEVPLQVRNPNTDKQYFESFGNGPTGLGERLQGQSYNYEIRADGRGSSESGLESSTDIDRIRVKQDLYLDNTA